MKKNRLNKFIRNPKKALFALAIPTIAGMLVQTLYNIVDTAFVGRLGADALAALTFSYPLFFLLIAVNSGVTAGMSSLISRYIGAKNKTAAENTAMHGLLLSMLCAVLIVIFGNLFLSGIFDFFGAAGNVKVLAMQYMSIMLYGALFMFPTFLGTSILSAQGDTKSPLIVQISAIGLNIILDPIFIYVLDYGVKGAAIASFISFFIASLIATIVVKKKSYLRIARKSFDYSFYLIKEILKVGFPAMLMMLLTAAFIMFINKFMVHYGVDYVAAFGMANRLEQIAFMPIVGISFAAMTLAGMFYGARRHDLLKVISWYAIKVGIIFMAGIGLIFVINPGIFLRIFTSDPRLIEIATSYIRLSVLTYPLMCIGTIGSRILQGMGYGLPGLIINLIRVFFGFVPFAYLFVYVLDLTYMWIAVAMIIGGVLAASTTLLWLHSKFKKYDSM